MAMGVTAISPYLLSLISTVLLQLANLTTGVILARVLGPADRGEIAALTAIVISTTVLTGMSFSEAFVYWLSRSKPNYRRYIGSAILIAGSLGIVGTISLFTLSPIMSHITQLGISDLWPWLLYPLTYQLAVAGVALARGVDLHNRWAIIRVSTTANYAILLIAFLLLDKLTVKTIGMASVGGQLLSLLLSLWLLRKPLRNAVANWPATQAIISYAAKLHPSAFSGLAREQFDKIILFYLVPADDLGRYVVGIALGLIPVAAAVTIDQVLFPSLVNIENPILRRQACLMQIRMMGTLIVGGLVVAIPLTPIAVDILFGQEYLIDVGVPMAAVAVGFLQSLKTVFNIALKAEFMPGTLGINEMIGLVASFTLIVPLVWHFGIYGAPLASGIGGMTALALTIRTTSKHYNAPLSNVLLPHRGDLTALISRLSGRQ
jgi:O-antigen/teichoic acid export membrane protein